MKRIFLLRKESDARVLCKEIEAIRVDVKVSHPSISLVFGVFLRREAHLQR